MAGQDTTTTNTNPMLVTVVPDTGQTTINTNPMRVIIDGGSSGEGGLTPEQEEKLDGIETGAQRNVQSDWNASAGDSFIRNKPAIGTAASRNASDFALASQLSTKADLVEGIVPESQLPSYIDNVQEYDSVASFPETGQDNVIYVSTSTNATYRWTGTQYAQLGSGLTLGTTNSTAFAGNRGVALESAVATKVDQTNTSFSIYGTDSDGDQTTLRYDQSQATASTVAVRDGDGRIEVADPSTDTQAATKKYVDDAVEAGGEVIAPGTTSQYFRGDKTWQTLDKSAVGLGNVDNTSDASKPVSAPTFAALVMKENLITPSTTDQYYRGDKSWATLNKGAVGLGNVDNTSDANKPISNAQALVNSAKADLVDGTVPTTQLPSYVDSVQEYANLSAFPTTGQSNVVYLAINTNMPYRWGGSSYVEITSGGIALGETSSTAYRGDRGKTAFDHTSRTDNPHAVTKAQVGLANVDNTSDNNKPISTATQSALNGKEATVTAGTTSQYYRGDKTWQTLNASTVGLGNVNNTSDANKPVSTATQTALNAKQNTLVSGTSIKTVNGVSVLGSGNIPIDIIGLLNSTTANGITTREYADRFEYVGKSSYSQSVGTGGAAYATINLNMTLPAGVTIDGVDEHYISVRNSERGITTAVFDDGARRIFIGLHNTWTQAQTSTGSVTVKLIRYK